MGKLTEGCSSSSEPMSVRRLKDTEKPGMRARNVSGKPLRDVWWTLTCAHQPTPPKQRHANPSCCLKQVFFQKTVRTYVWWKQERWDCGPQDSLASIGLWSEPQCSLWRVTGSLLSLAGSLGLGACCHPAEDELKALVLHCCWDGWLQLGPCLQLQRWQRPVPGHRWALAPQVSTSVPTLVNLQHSLYPQLK